MVQEKVTRSEAILAMCHQCLGHYSDGKVDCECQRCPLYSFMPYARKEPELEWMQYNHKMVGLVLKEDSKREYTEEQREVLRARLESARSARLKTDE